MGGKATVETKDLTKSYDGTIVVDHLNLRIAEEEIFGLLGPNGAGKTTTILMLLGLTEPSSGSAKVCGFNPIREPLKVKRLIGYMPEKIGFYESLTARENLDFIAHLNQISAARAREKIDELLRVVGLGDAPDKPVGTFSRGMKQRLAVADALIKEPKVVFFDEPTAGLDPEGIIQILDLVAGLPQVGTTVILSSHRLYEVQKVCHRVGILSKGKLVVEGSIEQLGRQAFAGSRYRIEIETTQPASQLIDIVKKVTGIANVEAEDNRLLISTDSDLRAEIAKILVQNNVSLIQMKVQEFALDDVYMKYFQEG